MKESKPWFLRLLLAKLRYLSPVNLVIELDKIWRAGKPTELNENPPKSNNTTWPLTHDTPNTRGIGVAAWLAPQGLPAGSLGFNVMLLNGDKWALVVNVGIFWIFIAFAISPKACLDCEDKVPGTSNAADKAPGVWVGAIGIIGARVKGFPVAK